VVNNASPKECWLEIPQVQPIVQAAVLIKTKHSAQAAHFAQFLVSPEAEAIRKKYGYE
jgi:ABC-type molybdate transport system substrate-binding protein